MTAFPTTVPLNSYFGVELRGSESPHAVSEAVCTAAKEAKTLFLRLEVMDTISVGGTKFVRFRSDLLNMAPMLDTLFAQKRSVIQQGTQGYTVRFTSGRQGPINGLLMHSTSKPGQGAMYKGPKVALWEQAFRKL
jgi:hypothetical protein